MILRKLIGSLVIFLVFVSAGLATPPHVNLELRGQAVRGDSASSKFDEYRTVPRGPYLERLSLEGGDTFYYKLEGLRLGLGDQRITLKTGLGGLHRFSLKYDQWPHNLSNTARTFLRNDGNGVFSLPDNMQSSLQTSTANAPGFFPWSPVVPSRVDKKKGGFAYIYNPTGRWRANVNYEAEKRDGLKPLGVTYGFGQIEEVLEPVDYLIHDLNIGTEYAGGHNLGFRVDYRLSLFENRINALTVDNPFQLADGAISASGASTPGRARLALPPANQAHRLSLSLKSKVSPRSSLTASLGYQAQFQDEPFLPLTVNSNILNDPRLPSLPQNSLNAKLYTLNGAVKWNWKPSDAVSFNLHGKHYNQDNRTPSIVFDQYVQFDTNFATSTPTNTFKPDRSRRSLPREYDKTTLGTDLYYFLAKSIGMKVGYDWEQVSRKFREAESNMENIFYVSWDIKTYRMPFRYLVFRPGYRYSFRTVKNYDAERVAEATFPLGEGTALGQLQSLRKFDEAGRKQHKANLRMDWEPLVYLQTTLDSGITHDDFLSDYGALDGKTFYYSIAFNISPSDRYNLYSDYTWERMITNTLARARGGVLGDTSSNDWKGFLQDTVHSINTGITYNLIKDKLDSDLGWSWSYAKGSQQASNPNTITAATALATDLPNTYYHLSRVRAGFKYHVLKDVMADLRYEYQRYSRIEWSQDNLNVYQSIWNKSVFLAALQPGYNAHLVSLGLSYKF